MIPSHVHTWCRSARHASRMLCRRGHVAEEGAWPPWAEVWVHAHTTPSVPCSHTLGHPTITAAFRRLTPYVALCDSRPPPHHHPRDDTGTALAFMSFTNNKVRACGGCLMRGSVARQGLHCTPACAPRVAAACSCVLAVGSSTWWHRRSVHPGNSILTFPCTARQVSAVVPHCPCPCCCGPSPRRRGWRSGASATGEPACE